MVPKLKYRNLQDQTLKFSLCFRGFWKGRVYTQNLHFHSNGFWIVVVMIFAYKVSSSKRLLRLETVSSGVFFLLLGLQYSLSTDNLTMQMMTAKMIPIKVQRSMMKLFHAMMGLLISGWVS